MSGGSVRSKTKWSFDLNLKDQDAGYAQLQSHPAPFGMKRIRELERQAEKEMMHGGGQVAAGGAGEGAMTAQSKMLAEKKRSRAMTFAMGTGKQIPMNAFMMYMSGKTLNIFSISVTSSAVLGPLKSILTINTVFKQFEDPDGKVDLQLPKLLFLALNLVWFGVGLYKMGSMKLLPTTSADWTGKVVWKEMMETSAVPPSWT